MKKNIACGLLILLLILVSSCEREQKKQETPKTGGNPIEQYGSVMSQSLQKAKGMDAILPLKQLIDSFYVEQGRYPTTLQELVEKNYIKEIPAPPRGYDYHYESSTGKITLKPVN
ncbi:MAG: type II secretion system protein GspG [Candidatus Omnitrophica bacterium]|nr:type II secretion system protein GspG [Candidatus Omnitrophota bacterium]